MIDIESGNSITPTNFFDSISIKQTVGIDANGDQTGSGLIKKTTYTEDPVGTFNYNLFILRDEVNYPITVRSGDWVNDEFADPKLKPELAIKKFK